MSERGKYDDIINLGHPTSKKHPRMPIRDRAAQFAPFSALVGYDEAVAETARVTDDMIEQSDEMKAELNLLLTKLRDMVEQCPEISVTYFVPDERKSGGRYETIYGYLKSIDTNENCIVLMDKRKILFSKIRSLDSTAFNETSFE